jgi:general secretion pathway protein A
VRAPGFDPTILRVVQTAAGHWFAMYNNYFSLKQAPFSIAPDPRYLFMSERHREALAHLLYGIDSGGGFVLLTGEIGAGKTTVCRCFIEQVPPNCRLAYIFNPRLTALELLLSICDEFGITLPPRAPGADGAKVYVDAINQYLLDAHARGLNNVLVIDEAQNLSADVLEQLRLLTNLETSERKLLQIVLIGQPELRQMVERPELEQLAQRVIARYHLGPLSESETGAYVAHRLAVAGGAGPTPIPNSLTSLIHRLAQGVPRRINLLCDRALLGAYVENSREVTRPILRRAATEVFGDGNPNARRHRWPVFAGGVAAAVAISAAAAWQAIPRQASAPVIAKAAPAIAKAAPMRSAVAAPAPANTEAAPAKPVVHANADAALRELAALWGQPLPAGEAPCQAALKLNLRCHQGRGGLYELRLLDRPAIVTLHDGAHVGYAVLTHMDDASATLRAGGKLQTVHLAALAPMFDGEYTTFWRVPRAFRDQVGAGDQGPDVDWIAQRLAQVDKAAEPAAGQPLGKQMQERLRGFQASQNLKADGVAGPRTYMRLNQLSGVQEPRLLSLNRTGK